MSSCFPTLVQCTRSSKSDCPVVVAQGARGVPRGGGGPVARVHRCRPCQEALRAGPGPQAGAAGDAQALQQGLVRLSFETGHHVLRVLCPAFHIGQRLSIHRWLCRRKRVTEWCCQPQQREHLLWHVFVCLETCLIHPFLYTSKIVWLQILFIALVGCCVGSELDTASCAVMAPVPSLACVCFVDTL